MDHVKNKEKNVLIISSEMFLLQVDNKVFSQITDKIADKSQNTENWVFTAHRKN